MLGRAPPFTTQTSPGLHRGYLLRLSATLVQPCSALLTCTHEGKVKREVEEGITLEAPQTPGLAFGLPGDRFFLPPSKLVPNCHPATLAILALSLCDNPATFAVCAFTFHGYHPARVDLDSLLPSGPSDAFHGDNVLPQILEHLEE